MNFEEILKNKQHNPHFLNRYIKFINQCKILNSEIKNVYTEKHHICPKSKDMFPEYSSFVKHPWNLSVLTYRQHVIAHILLWKSYNTVSQTLSLLRSSKQYHTLNLNIKKVNSRFIESAKIDLSNKRKGIFTRGYDENGIAKVSEKTKMKISSLKKQFYSKSENREKQSKSCQGIIRKNTENISLYAKNRSIEHKNNLKVAINSYFKNTSKLQRSKIKTGIYITPIGNFTSCDMVYSRYCKNFDKPFTEHSFKHNTKSKWINRSIIGKTPKELGFYFIRHDDPAITQYYDELNLVHPPEPNHPLSLELNDCLLHEKLRLQQ